MRLAYIGSIKDDILNIEELALGLIGYLQEFYPAAIRERYNVEEELKPLDILTAVAKARGCLKKGEELDYEKASRLLLEEFRSGKLGKVNSGVSKRTGGSVMETMKDIKGAFCVSEGGRI